MSHADSIGGDPTDVRRFEVVVDDQAVTVIVDTEEDSRIIVHADQRWAMEIEDEWAYPCWDDRSMPRWLEGVVRDFGVRGIRTSVGGDDS